MSRTREWQAGSGRDIRIRMTREQWESGSHAGPCDEDIARLATFPSIARQIATWDPDILRDELREYGAWDELADHDSNIERMLWIACADLREDCARKSERRKA